jgi:hypothetical protein
VHAVNSFLRFYPFNRTSTSTNFIRYKFVLNFNVLSIYYQHRIKESFMSHKSFAYLMILLSLILAACSPAKSTTPQASPTNTASLTATATAAPAATNTAPVPTNILVPTAAVTVVPSEAPTSPASNPPAPVPIPASDNYKDDRSTPSQVIVSLYNAINRHEYLRAYSYWSDPSTSLGPLNAYASGYQNTASVDLVFGQITGDAGMSQVYYTIPVILKATATNGTRTNYAACYVVHAASPDVFGAPPIQPMSIERGSAKISDVQASEASVLSTACSGYPEGPLQVPVSGSTLNIDNSNFLDNRSGPIETVSSLLNALNLKQYVRAYSYFQDPATFPGPYDTYAAGYANTTSITVTFGTVQSEGAAGSLYYQLPLALHVLTTSSARQTFVGCYTLRLTQPAVQGTPPFQPMGIISGKFNQVDNSTDVNPLLPSACQ